MTGSVCGYPGCDHDETAHRPYAHLRDGIPSASAIAGSLDDGRSRSFAWAAAQIAADTAVHHTADWWQLPSQPCTHDIHSKPGICKACQFIRSEFDRQWRAKANLGSHIHHLALAWARGESVDTDETTSPYMDALERFYDERVPVFSHLERTVRYSDDPAITYRGQFDFIATINDGVRLDALVDIKTGGYYPVEHTLQLAGYRYADWLTDWPDGREVLGEPMPKVDAAGVLLLGGDGTYRLILLPADRDAHAQFLALRETHGWAKDVERWDKAREKAEAAA